MICGDSLGHSLLCEITTLVITEIMQKFSSVADIKYSSCIPLIQSFLIDAMKTWLGKGSW
jgi:hypothetical protein